MAFKGERSKLPPAIQRKDLPLGTCFAVVASFGQYPRPSRHVIPAKAGIHSATLREFAAYKLDSRFRGNDVSVVGNEGSNDATACFAGPLTHGRCLLLYTLARPGQ